MNEQSIRGSFVTPWVYTKVTEVGIPTTSNIGITSLGVVGETLKGPAFEIINVTNWKDYKTYFGGTSTEKFKSNGFPKYELPYIAKEYFAEGNNLYVSRILGLSGYEAGRAWAIVLDGDSTNNEKQIAAIIRSKGSLKSGQIMQWGIADNETLTAQGITLTNPFTIGVAEQEEVTNLTIPVNSTVLTGILSKNGTLVTSGTSISANGIDVDITDGYFGGSVDLSGVTGTTIPTEENATQIFRGKYRNNNTLELTDGVTFYMYNTTLQSSVKITTQTPVTISNVTLDGDGNLVYTAASTINLTSTNVSYFLKAATGAPLANVSLEMTDSNFILNVLGEKMDDVEGEVIWVDEYYLDGYDFGALIEDQTLSIELVELPKYDVNNFKAQYAPARTPWIVSSVVGGKVKNLFRFISISDGESSNTEIKASIENVDEENKTFDVIVRGFGDTDDNVVVYEAYRNLNLIKDDRNYIGRRIGDSAGEYGLVSKFIVVDIASGSLQNEIPSGFQGFPVREHGSYTYPTPSYKTQFLEDVKPRRQYLGIQSSNSQTFDLDLLKYKGINNSTDSDWGTIASERTKGFHIQVEASGFTEYITPTTSAFIDPDTGEEFTGDDKKLRYKFTTMFYNGFDGWNIYSENRGLSSDYKYNKKEGKAGLANQSFRYFSDNDFPEGTKAITSDYYAYYKGFRVFSNPKTVDINLLATPGIDWSNQASLVDEVIDMIENERCDALYLVNSPDTISNSNDSLITPKEISQMMTDSGFNSKFATTVYPWIQYADTENDSKYLWLSPIKDLCRTIAYTDNVAYPWFAPVGWVRGAVTGVKARTRLKNSDTEALVKANMNYVESFTKEGLKLWGEKLMCKDADNFVLSRIGTQRLMLYLRANIRDVVKKDIFEQNDEVIVDTIRKQIMPILESVAGQRGIEKDFDVDVLQTPEDKDQRQVRVKIYLKPIGALEYIEIEFFVNPSQVSF